MKFIIALMIAASLHVHAQSYRTGAGDILSINVLGENEFSGSFTINTDGSIDYPYIKKIEVKEKTVEEISEILTGKLKEGYLKDPQVTVAVKEYNSQQILVVGAVAKPGKYVLKGETSIIDALSLAGGISSQGGKKIILLRGASVDTKKSEEPLKNLDKIEPVIVDYYSLVHQGDLSQNVTMKNGDILNIPEANEIFVLGNVAKPGPVKFEEKMTIVQAVTLAGGPTPTASTRSTYILRHSGDGQKRIPIRLDKILENKDKNVSLFANDVIVVPESFF